MRTSHVFGDSVKIGEYDVVSRPAERGREQHTSYLSSLWRRKVWNSSASGIAGLKAVAHAALFSLLGKNTQNEWRQKMAIQYRDWARKAVRFSDEKICSSGLYPAQHKNRTMKPHDEKAANVFSSQDHLAI